MKRWIKFWGRWYIADEYQEIKGSEIIIYYMIERHIFLKGEVEEIGEYIKT